MAFSGRTKLISQLTESTSIADSDNLIVGNTDAKKITWAQIIALIKTKLNIGSTSIADIGDGTITGAIKNNADNIDELNGNNAGAHNSIYRGKNLGNAVTDAQWQAISSGTFIDLYIGDYWVIDGVNWRIAAFDYYLYCGDIEFLKHHAVIVPDACLYNHAMNDADITTGAYVNSKMYTEGLSQAKSIINSAFGISHVLSHRNYFTNSVSDGITSAGALYDSEVDLMCEHMVYGSGIYNPVSDGATIPYNYRMEKGQLPLFRHEPSRICNRKTWWLRDVISASRFASVSSNGSAYHTSASTLYGVRPAFCIG